jgi:uncharacterized protein YkwD
LGRDRGDSTAARIADKFRKTMRNILAGAKPTLGFVPVVLFAALIAALVSVAPTVSDGRPLKRGAQASGSTSTGGAAALLSNFRRSNGLSAVSADSRLMQLAQQHARAMAASDSLSHGDFVSRIRSAGIRGEAAENISAGYHNLPDAFASWVNSSSHRANMLIPSITRMGIGAAAAPHSRYKMYWALIVAGGSDGGRSVKRSARKRGDRTATAPSAIVDR